MPWRFFSAIEMTSIALHAASATVTVSIGLISPWAALSPQAKVRPEPVVAANRLAPSWTSVALRMVAMGVVRPRFDGTGSGPILLRRGRHRLGGRPARWGRSLELLVVEACVEAACREQFGVGA